MTLAVDQFVLLDAKQHDLKRFDCGKLAMNQFISRYADKNRKLGLSSTWVLAEKTSPREHKKAVACAYYTLASATVSREQIPSEKKLPAYPVPVVLVTALRQCVCLTDKGLPALGVVMMRL